MRRRWVVENDRRVVAKFGIVETTLENVFLTRFWDELCFAAGSVNTRGRDTQIFGQHDHREWATPAHGLMKQPFRGSQPKSGCEARLRVGVQDMNTNTSTAENYGKGRGRRSSCGAAFLIRDRDDIHDLWNITWMALCHGLFASIEAILAFGTLPMRWSHLSGQAWTFRFDAEDLDKSQ